METILAGARVASGSCEPAGPSGRPSLVERLAPLRAATTNATGAIHPPMLGVADVEGLVFAMGRS